MSASGYDWEPLIAISALTDLGLKRSNNQDSLVVDLASHLADWRERGHLFVVADGMGAHAAGELASKLAVDQVAYLYRKHRDRSPNDALLAAIQAANDDIHRRGQANLSFHNMGTTCSSLLLLPQGAVVAHVGDSRVYVCRHGVLRQLTFDHSLVWEMQQATQSYGGQAELSFPKNVITRSIGPHASVKIDLEGPFAIEMGDTFLLCSDGLTGRVDDGEIASSLTYLSSDRAARLLLDLALLRGGHDNITLIVIRIQGDDLVTRASGTSPLTVGDP
ncbi:MAG TPA: protein phosphatase 2C domain-containing protein, partial [Pirellulaceae bacterium]